MYKQSHRVYDAIYTSPAKEKDYAAEAERVVALVDTYGPPGARTLLDVACGTGLHLAHLRERFAVEGIDIEPAMLDIARHRLAATTTTPDPAGTVHHAGDATAGAAAPGGPVPLEVADMVDFDLGRRFDAVICLFSSIGYVKTVSRLDKSAASMARHLEPGGVLVVEPWFTPEEWHPGTVHADFVDQPRLKVCRMNKSEVDGTLSVMDMHHMVATPADGVEHFVERHELGLFTDAQYRAALEGAGLSVEHLADGLYGRGLYIGVAPN